MKSNTNTGDTLGDARFWRRHDSRTLSSVVVQFRVCGYTALSPWYTASSPWYTAVCHPHSQVRPSSSPLGPVRGFLPADVVALRLGLPAPLRDHRGRKLGGEYLNLLPL